jgi:hypothetical protein
MCPLAWCHAVHVQAGSLASRHALIASRPLRQLLTLRGPPFLHRPPPPHPRGLWHVGQNVLVPASARPAAT